MFKLKSVITFSEKKKKKKSATKARFVIWGIINVFSNQNDIPISTINLSIKSITLTKKSKISEGLN